MVVHNAVWKITLHCSKLKTNKVTFWTWYLTCCLLGLWFVIMQCIKDTYYIDTNLTGINGIANWSPIIKCDAKLILHSCEPLFWLIGLIFCLVRYVVFHNAVWKITLHWNKLNTNQISFWTQYLICGLLGLWFVIVQFISRHILHWY